MTAPATNEGVNRSGGADAPTLPVPDSIPDFLNVALPQSLTTAEDICDAIKAFGDYLRRTEDATESMGVTGESAGAMTDAADAWTNLTAQALAAKDAVEAALKVAQARLSKAVEDAEESKPDLVDATAMGALRE